MNSIRLPLIVIGALIILAGVAWPIRRHIPASVSRGTSWSTGTDLPSSGPAMICLVSARAPAQWSPRLKSGCQMGRA
jgi:hypothetical protein